MSKRNKIRIFIIFIMAMAGCFYFFMPRNNTEIDLWLSGNRTVIEQVPETKTATSTVIDTATSTESKAPSITDTATPAITAVKNLIVQNVPFSPQAPFAEWSDIRQEDGCEEMSAIMAMRWVKKTDLSREEALHELIAITDYETKTYGYNQDSAVADTAKRIFNEYFEYSNVRVKSNITIADIIEELEQGRIVIVPVNGKTISNPNYKNGGPERHNILIKGYDRTAKEFITNDPGTRKGENYRYDEMIMFEALRDYPSGQGAPITTVEKNMIIVWR